MQTITRRNYVHSHSGLELYHQCPYLYFRLKEFGAGITTRAMDFGSAVHLAIQMYGQYCQETNQQSDLAKLDWIVDDAGRECNLDTDQINELHELMDDFSRQMLFEDKYRYEVQLRFDSLFQPVPDGDTGAAWVGCMLDLMYPIDADNGVYCIIDYKSDRCLYKAGHPRMKKYQRQLQRYAAMLIQANDDCQIVYACDFFVRYGVQSDPIIVRRGEHTEILKQFSDELIAADEDDEHLTRCGDHCSLCPIANTCPAYEKLPAENRVIINDGEDARKYANQLFILKAIVSQLEKGLGEYAIVGGPIHSDGGDYGFWPSKETSYTDASKVLDGLKQHGIDWQKHLVGMPLPKTFVENLVKAATPERSKQRKELKAFAATFLTENTVTKFGIKKAEDDE